MIKMTGFAVALAGAIALAGANASATGLATCKVGPESGWKSQDELTKMLTAKGWRVNRIKVDGNCYEVYGFDKDGKRVEAYFHPESFDAVPNGSTAFAPR